MSITIYGDPNATQAYFFCRDCYKRVQDMEGLGESWGTRHRGAVVADSIFQRSGIGVHTPEEAEVLAKNHDSEGHNVYKVFFDETHPPTFPEQVENSLETMGAYPFWRSGRKEG